MFAWTWEWCFPDLVCFGITVIVVGWIVWVLGEQRGWESGFLDGAELKDFEREEREREYQRILRSHGGPGPGSRGDGAGGGTSGSGAP